MATENSYVTLRDHLVPRAGPEAEARKEIDRRLEAAGWILQDRRDVNPLAALGVAVREYPMK